MNSIFKKMILLSLLLTLQAHADTYPSKMIRIVEPAGPGSAVDNAARSASAQTHAPGRARGRALRKARQPVLCCDPRTRSRAFTHPDGMQCTRHGFRGP